MRENIKIDLNRDKNVKSEQEKRESKKCDVKGKKMSEKPIM